MMAEKAPSAAPAWALPCWVDGSTLFFELQGLDGPIVVSFARHELSKALAILYARYEVEGHGEPYTRPQLASSIPDKNGITGRQRQDAHDILKKLKII